MLTIGSSAAFALLLLTSAYAAPQQRQRQGAQLTAQQQAAQIPQDISVATDGSTILDTTVTVK